MPGLLILKYGWRHLFYFVSLNVALVLRGRGRAALRACWGILRALPMLLKKRAAIQRRRKTTLLRLEALFERESLWGLLRRQRMRSRQARASASGVGAEGSIPAGGPAWE